MEQRSNQSEIARLLALIEAEYTAAQQGLIGLAETAKHQIIAARTERIGKLHKELQELAGEEAMKLIDKRLGEPTKKEEDQEG